MGKGFWEPWLFTLNFADEQIKTHRQQWIYTTLPSKPGGLKTRTDFKVKVSSTVLPTEAGREVGLAERTGTIKY